MEKLFFMRGFKPFLFIAFLNICIDLGHKITLANILIKSYQGSELLVYNTILGMMMIVPYIFLFTPSGFINDRFNTIKVMQFSTLASLIIAILISFCYLLKLFWVAYALSVLLVAQSAIYGPAKYLLIKKIVGVENIGIANGIVQAVNTLGIMCAAFLFSYLFENSYSGSEPNEIIGSIFNVAIVLVSLGLCEFISSLFLPKVENPHHINEFNINNYIKCKYLSSNLKLVFNKQNIFLSIIGLSIFYGSYHAFISTFPAHFKAVVDSSNTIAIQSIMSFTSIGIIAGSLIAGNMSKNHIELGIVPIGALGLFLSLFTISYVKSAFLFGVCSFAFGFFGSFIIVPLNATIQYFGAQNDLGKILAANNFFQKSSILLFLCGGIFLSKLAFSTTNIFLFISLILLLASIFTIKQVPHLFTRILLRPILKSQYKLHINGLKNLPKRGGFLLLGNHISLIDWIVLQIACPRAIKFVMYHNKFENNWFMRWFIKFFRVIPIEQNSYDKTIEAIKERLNNGEVVAMFPENSISYNGQINEFKKDFELAVCDTNAPIVPFYIRGLWGSSFSRASEYYKKLKSKNEKEVIVAFGKLLKNDINATQARQKVLELSFSSWNEFISNQAPLMHHWIEYAKDHLFKTCIVDNINGTLNNLKFITAVLIFSKLFKKRFDDKNIGIILPSSAVGAIVNMALFIIGKSPINLNYTLNSATINASIKKANIKHIMSSKMFIQKLEQKGFELDNEIKQKLIFAEDLKAQVTPFLKFRSLFKALIAPAWYIKMFDFASVKLDDTATILFSSGSESEPKGIELSHKNLLTNIKQMSELLNFNKHDCMVNSLPIFHSFGLTVTTLMPLCEGMKMVSVPDPTDAYLVGQMVYRHNATILFGTSTFFRLYNKNKKLHPLMFRSLRMVIAGAEKLKPNIQDGFRLKFGHEIYEGYGTTETAPVASVNMPNMLDPDTLNELTFNHVGSVGLPLPGTIIKIVDPDTLSELSPNQDGLILIGGPQVMKGYLDDPVKSDEVIVTIDGIRYYKTGDKGYMDEQGFIYIIDRYSRFAKIGGEMISLGAIEEALVEIFGNETQLITTNVPDDKKGEAIVLLIKSELDMSQIKECLKNAKLNALMMPGYIFLVDYIPVLGSGKADFKSAKNMALELLLKGV